MAADIPNPEELTEDQLRDAYEQEIKRVRVEHVLLENVVTMVNLGMRRTGLMPGTEGERDLAQVQLAIESVRALLPQLDAVAPQQAGSIRDALSQLQMAFVQASGGQAPGAASAAPGAESGAPGAGPDAPGAPERTGEEATPDSAGEAQAPKPGEPGPAQSSGRLWVPGQ